MDQEKIGKFIAKCRKGKKLTQQDLAEKLGVSDRTIGNWENGRNLPDVSLFKPLCDELNITINDLISGEKIDNDKYQEKSEENIINTINYANRKINEKSNIIGIILIISGICISILALAIYSNNNPVNEIGSIIGLILSIIGINKLARKLSYLKRLLLIIVFLIVYSCVMFTLDVTGIINMDFSFYI